MNGVIRSDSNAAIGITHRSRLGGRCRHIKVQYLWIQERVKSSDLKLKKVNGLVNSADLMTKAVNGETLERHIERMGFEARGGRAGKASELNRRSRTESEKKIEKEESESEKKSRAAGKEVKVMSPQCVRVHDVNGRQIKGRRWVREG